MQTPCQNRRRFLALLPLLVAVPLGAVEPPPVGAIAPDFSLRDLDGRTHRLREQAESGPVVLVVLRGWPGYQCPLCDRQVTDYLGHADAFARAGARVVFVYPGPADGLREHAAEFRTWKGRKWPASMPFLLDPDHSMVGAYGLRWEAPGETAYPSTFILDRDLTVRFARISRSHGGRTQAGEVLKALPGRE